MAMKDLQSSRIHSRLIAILVYALRKNTVVVTDRQTDTHSVFHFESESGLAKLGVSPWGGGRAGSMISEGV